MSIAKNMFKKAYPDIAMENFKGVNPYDKKEMNRICNLFHLALYIHTPKKAANGKTKFIYRCTVDGANIFQQGKPDFKNIDLFYYNKRFSYISDINKFTGEFDCEKCKTYFNTIQGLSQHNKNVHKEKKVSNKIKNGYYTPKLYFKQQLKNQGIPEELLTNIPMKHFMCFDIEASLLNKTANQDILEDNATDGKDNYLLQKHQTMCIALTSTFSKTKIFNLKSYDSKGPIELIHRFIVHALKLAKMAEKLYLKENRDLISYIEYIKKQATAEKNQYKIRFAEKILNNISKYASVIPILGYNSARYDIQVLRYDGLFIALNQLDSPIKVIKKGGFMKIQTKHLLFLDAIKYLGGGYNLRRFVKAFAPNVKETKSYFPYEAVNELKKLKNNFFPFYSMFESKLNGGNTLEEESREYNLLIKNGLSISEACKELKIEKPPLSGRQIYHNLKLIWRKKRMKTWEEYMNYYVYLDVVPFKKALENLLKYFHEKEVDLFKKHCSLSSAAVNMLFHSVTEPQENSFFYLDKENYDHIRRTILGGLVICSQRLFDCSGGMLIKEYKYKGLALPGKIIISYDFNNLYGGIMGAMSHLTGPYVQRDLEDEYSLKWVYENSTEKSLINKGCFTWLTHEALNYRAMYGSPISIQSAYNRGEKAILVPSGKKYRVDGYVNKQPHNGRPLILEYLGCYYHAHPCGQCLNSGYKLDEYHPLKINNKGGRMTNKEVYEETMARIEEIKALGHDVQIMWECEWTEKLKKHPSISNSLQNYLISNLGETEYIKTENEMLKAILEEKVYGIVFCSVNVPENLQDTVFEYPPIFKKIENYSLNKLPDKSYLKTYCQKHGLEPSKSFLTNLLAGNDLVLPSEFVRHLIIQGYQVKNVRRVLQFGNPHNKPFKKFVDEMVRERREGAKEGNTVSANMAKLILNASVGFTLMKSNTLPNVEICDEKRSKKIKRLHSGVSCCEFLGPSQDVQKFYFKKKKQKISDLFLIAAEKNNPPLISNMPVLLGWKVLAMAKLQMLEFMEKARYYFDDAKWTFLYSDTDSVICALAENNIDDCIRECHKEEWKNKKREIFVTNEEGICDNFTPLRLKIEAVGDKFACISAKMYCIAGTNDEIIKSAQKGVKLSLNRELINYEKYKRIILELGHPPGNSKYVGFLSSYKDDGFWTIQMEKRSFAGLYFKRLVLDNGYWTQPLDWEN